MTMPTQDELKKIFDYHPDGTLTWKIHSGKSKIGKPAGVVNPNGYLRTGFNKKIYANHRLIYMLHHGNLPEMVDHIDGNPLNNRIENLRPANKYQNQQNQKLTSRNSSGFKNVGFCNQTKKWVVSIRINNKPKTIGRFSDIELADLVAQECRSLYHGEYARSY